MRRSGTRVRYEPLLQMLEDCAAALERGTPVGLVLVDVAGLTEFNLAYGRATGDRALAQVRRRAAREASRAAAWRRVYRIGGDEFALLVRGCPPDAFARLVERLHALRLAGSPGHPGLPLHVGWALAPEDGADAAQLLAVTVQRLTGTPVAPGGGCSPHLAHVTHWLVAAATALRRRARRFAHLARTDPLTRLPNQRAVRQAVRAALRRGRQTGQPFAVLMVDGDGLKAYNARLGYEAGNAMIARLARTLRQALPHGAFLGRWLSGDEFIAVVPGPDALVVAESLCATVARASAAWPIPVTVSVGVARWPDHGDDAELLLRRAAAANDVAKDAGKNRVVEWVPP